MTIVEAIVLGTIQGLTEFLPISSTAHLLVVRQWLGHHEPEDAFTTVVQMGTLVAVLWYFRSDVAVLARAVLQDLRRRHAGSSPEARLAWLIVLGTIPVVLVGGLAKGWLKATFYNVPAMAVVAIVFALLMAAAELWARWRHAAGQKERGESEVGWGDALWIGVWQALALMPGASRSGTTLTAGLFAGMARSAAARFSFLLSLPSILAAGVKELYDEAKKLRDPSGAHGLFASGDELTTLLIGLVVSAVVGYLAIAWLLGYLRHRSTAAFIVYRLVMGGLLLELLRRGFLVM